MTRRPLSTPDPSGPIDAARAAEAAATLDALFRTHYHQLYAVAYRYLQSRALAEEAIQDAFFAMWERRHEWGQARDLARYTAAVVRNRALGHLRRERLELTWQQHAAASPEEASLSQFAIEAGASAETDDLAERVRAALRTLPERAQYTLGLRLYRQLTNTEIAEVMGITVKAVERNLARAMQALRVTLTDPRE